MFCAVPLLFVNPIMRKARREDSTPSIVPAILMTALSFIMLMLAVFICFEVAVDVLLMFSAALVAAFLISIIVYALRVFLKK